VQKANLSENGASTIPPFEPVQFTHSITSEPQPPQAPSAQEPPLTSNTVALFQPAYCSDDDGEGNPNGSVPPQYQLEDADELNQALQLMPSGEHYSQAWQNASQEYHHPNYCEFPFLSALYSSLQRFTDQGRQLLPHAGGGGEL
jgi:hypothetical protein